MTAQRQRFYREVTVARPERGSEGSGYRVLLDGKNLKTPAGAVLKLSNAALAEAIANEWRAQDSKLRPDTMILTKLANTAHDRVTPNPALVIEQLLAFGGSDLVCYRAEVPVELASRQALAWDPLLEWLKSKFGIELRTGTAITFLDQKPEAMAAWKQALAVRDPFQLSGLYAAASLLGSLAIAFALVEGKLSHENAFQIAQLDEIYQSEKWGLDPEIAQKRDTKSAELAVIAHFLELSTK